MRLVPEMPKGKGSNMSEPVRISPEEVRDKVVSNRALLVCSYAAEERFRRHHLEGAIALAEFESKLPDLAKDQQIVFYCA